MMYLLTYDNKELSRKVEKIITIGMIVFTLLLFLMIIVDPAAAGNEVKVDANVKQSLGGIADKFVALIGLLFQVSGLILGVFSAGQLIMAKRNDDSETINRAGSFLLVSLALIAFPAILSWLNLGSYINNTTT